jgi:hypothetical protein
VISESVLAGAVAVFLAAPAAARANDGFYQGAGSHLLPVKSDALRVRRETLVIAPVDPPTCAGILYRETPIWPTGPGF